MSTRQAKVGPKRSALLLTSHAKVTQVFAALIGKAPNKRFLCVQLEVNHVTKLLQLGHSMLHINMVSNQQLPVIDKTEWLDRNLLGFKPLVEKVVDSHHGYDAHAVTFGVTRATRCRS